MTGLSPSSPVLHGADRLIRIALFTVDVLLLTDLIVASYPIREGLIRHGQIYMFGTPVICKLFVRYVIPFIEVERDLQILFLRWK
jgi:hypothetical protein